MSRFHGRYLLLRPGVRHVLLFMSFAVVSGVLWWGTDRFSERGTSWPEAGPPAHSPSPSTAIASDRSALRSDETEADTPVGLAAEGRTIEDGALAAGSPSEANLGEAGVEEGREDAVANPARLAYERGARAQSRGDYEAALLAFREAVEHDSENPGYLEAAGHMAKIIGRLQEAEEFFGQALAVHEQTFGPDHPSVGRTLGLLGDIYADQRRYGDAETAYQRALAIQERAYGRHHTLVSDALSDLALLYQRRGRYGDALPLLESAVEIEERVWGAQHPNVAARLSALGLLYQNEGRFQEAELLLERALLIREQAYQPDHPETTGALTSLAHVYSNQGRYAEAESLLRRALAVNQSTHGSYHPRVAMDLANLGVLYVSQALYAEARPYYELALVIENEDPWSVTPQVSVGVNRLARAAQSQGHHEMAGEIYRWALDVGEGALGPENANTAFLRSQYVQYLRTLGQDE